MIFGKFQDWLDLVPKFIFRIVLKNIWGFLRKIIEKNRKKWFDLKDVDATVKTSNINIEVVNGSLNVVKLNAISKYKIINILEVGYVSTILMVLFLIVIYLFRGTLSIKKHNV